MNPNQSLAKPKIAFFGSSEFAMPSLQTLHKAGYPLLVITQPAKPQGRRLRLLPNPLAELAQKLGLQLFTPADVNDADSISLIRDFKPQFAVTASYGAIFGQELLRIAPYTVNLHPSLLPLLRGATPIQSAILQSFDTTGLTIFSMRRKMDAGPILIQKDIRIEAGENYSHLHDRLAELAADCLIEYISNPQSYPPSEQDHSRASYCGKIDAQSTRLDWNMPAQAIDAQIRAFSLKPGAWTLARGKQLKILASEHWEGAGSGKAGEIVSIVKNRGFAIQCADAPLFITSVQPEGKKLMSAWAYQLGARHSPGELFGS